MQPMIECTYPEFFDAGKTPALFEPYLAESLSQNDVLRLSLHPKGVTIRQIIQHDHKDPLVIHGRWISPHLSGIGSDIVGTELLMPFLFQFFQVDFHCREIFSLKIDRRSLAAFFMRNLFMSICRGVPIKIVPNMSQNNVDVLKNSLLFRKHYLYVMRASLTEKNLNIGNIMEVLSINIYLPILKFDNPILEAEANAIRQWIGDKKNQSESENNIPRFHRVRSRILSHYR